MFVYCVKITAQIFEGMVSRIACQYGERERRENSPEQETESFLLLPSVEVYWVGLISVVTSVPCVLMRPRHVSTKRDGPSSPLAAARGPQATQAGAFLSSSSF